MADAYTTTASLGLDQAAYDRFLYFALRPQNYFDAFVDVGPTNQSMPGTSVIFRFMSDLSVASTALNESVDVDAVALADTTVTVTLAEYGAAVITTALARGTAYAPLDAAAANIVGQQAGISLDTVARDTFKGGSNVRYAGQAVSRATVIPTDKLLGDNIRRAVAELKGANVMTFGGNYVGMMHPDVEYDFRADATATGWRNPHIYSSPQEIFNGEVGLFEGVRWIVSPRAPVFTDAGSSTTLTDVYRTLIWGRQAFAKAYSTVDGNGAYPRMVATPVTDHLRRFQGYGWYWLGGYAIFRQAALRAIESASSIGTNA